MAARKLFLALAVALAAAAAADETASTEAQAPPEVSIPFAGKNIWNWRVIDNRTVLIETNSHKWYKAKLLSPCIDLPFSERIGFESNPDGGFDKFSAIQTRTTRCPLVSLTVTDAPAKKSKKKAAAPAASSATP